MSPGLRSRGLVALATVVVVAGCRPDDSGTSAPGSAAPSAKEEAAETAGTEPPVSAVDGEVVYREHCAVCHMADGRGVPNMQPPVVGSPYLAGDEQKLVNVIRGGSAVLASDRPNPVANDMPPFGYLSQEEIDALVDYLKSAFAR